MNIAIFADLHGRVLLCFKLCARWEQETGEHIDLILQAGDLGAFPDEANLDKATRKYALADPTELGFMHDFATYKPNVAAVIQRVNCNLLFVRGNHEDHQWLDALEQQTAAPIFHVDAYQRVYCLKSGIPYTFQQGSEVLTVLGIGRIGPPGGDEITLQAKYIQPYESERIHDLKSSEHVDLLLTHDATRHLIYPDRGLEEIRFALDQHKPLYHFFGHYGGPSKQRWDINGVTSSYKLADLHWDRTSHTMEVEAGSMGILHWKNQQEHHFELIDTPWFKEYNAYTWEHL